MRKINNLNNKANKIALTILQKYNDNNEIV